MGDILIKGVDDVTFEQLKRVAEARRQTIEDVARELLASAVSNRRADVLAAADRIRAMTPKKLATSSTDLIRQDRDRR